MTKSTQISCPKCGHEFYIEDVLAHQIEEKYKEELNENISKIEAEYEEKEDILSKKEQKLKKQESDIEKQVVKRTKEESKKKEKEIKKQIEQEFEEQITSLKEENEEVNQNVKKLKNIEIQNEKLKREIEEQSQNLELEYEIRLNEKIKEKEESITKREFGKVDFKLKEKEKIIEDLSKQITEMHRKAEQGSVQLQGEVQEIAIEELLSSTFTNDLIEEVKKGAKGADVVHTILNNGCECGKILYESKRTKTFSNSWIEKLKNDAINAKANICVIVTETLPNDIDKIGFYDGVWICSFTDLKSIALLLRESLIAIDAVYIAQSNKGDKMEMLYDYLTGNEFKLQLEAMVEGFSNLQDSYIKEKRAMERLWKQREKQLEKIMINTSQFIGSIQGIAGNSIPEIEDIGSSLKLIDE